MRKVKGCLPFLAVCLLLVGLLSGCAHERVDPAYLALVEQQAELPPTGELGPGDRFLLRVYGEEALSGEFTVGADGTINYPHVGRFRADGLTCTDVEVELTLGLGQKFLKEPNVQCTIVEYNSKRIFIFGEVREPGTFPYKNNISIIEAFALAGGFNERASTNNTKLTRVVDGVEIQVRVPLQEIVEGRQRNLRLLPGDIIFVPESAY
ncbi:polysaccharide export protein [Bradymonadaceae bacterium TMQ3]|uniref:Polysaccharide export protein n=1 Tax=Lujinxingia sediminis TaxID=2480984 RepID=A0ABY0CPP2_9DELT|nr:polysaccharide biosynthesis/export family protein [Lujinxingia sediminis]RDV38026.1 polysaccharide export protein [Bradymonadaceae bacterium TMQ3]RVU42304.1 polysaccharide export protein [Lujinxingia sediminis]TXC75697.1 polysaccharide export protein [Bradymonadales bacterium TMQ1]